jgi:hypothetical protein
LVLVEQLMQLVDKVILLALVYYMPMVVQLVMRVPQVAQVVVVVQQVMQAPAALVLIQ